MSDDGASAEPEVVLDDEDMEHGKSNGKEDGAVILTDIPAKGRFVKKIVTIKFFKRTTTAVQYFENSKLAFSVSPVSGFCFARYIPLSVMNIFFVTWR